MYELARNADELANRYMLLPGGSLLTRARHESAEQALLAQARTRVEAGFTRLLTDKALQDLFGLWASTRTNPAIREQGASAAGKPRELRR